MELFASNIKIPFGGKISLKFFNSLFNDAGSCSLPVSFSAKLPVINRAFGFPVNKEAPDAGYIPARIKTSIIDLIGSWQVTESDKNIVEAYYRGNTGDFYSMIKDKLLTDLEFGGIHYPAGIDANVDEVLAYMTTQMDAVYPDNDWTAFMVYMTNVIAGNTPEVNIVEHEPGTGSPSFLDPKEYLTNAVYLFAGAIIDYIFSEFGYRVEKNIFREDPDLKRLVVFHTFNMRGTAAFDYKRLVPKVLISSFLKAVTKKFNIGFFINEQSRSVKVLSFDSIIAAEPASGKLYSSELKINKNKITGLSFAINSPDVWSRNSFETAAEIDPEGTMISVDKYSDINPVTMMFKIVFVIAESTYYKVNVEEITRIGPDMFDYIEGVGTTSIEQLSGTLGMYTLSKEYETIVDYIVPRCDLVSNQSGHPYTEFPLIFLLTRGKQDCQVYPAEGSFERQYPMGTSDIFDARGDAIEDATLALRWHGSSGIIERFWKNRINWEMNDKKIIKASFLDKDLSRLLDFSKIIRTGESNYIINSLEVELSNKITRITEAELFRL